MNKISIARALKEKSRLVGEINRIRQLIITENIKRVNIQVPEGKAFGGLTEEDIKRVRAVDVTELEAQWKALEEKLITLKTAIVKANAEAAETLVRLQEAKSHLAQVGQIGYREGIVQQYDGITVVDHSVLKQAYVLAEQKAYTDLVNKLQDDIDDFNARTFIDWEG